MRFDGSLELADDLIVVSEGELGIDALLDRGDAQLLEPDGLGAGEVVVRELCERRPAPQPECLVQGHHRRGRHTLRRLGTRSAHPVLESRPVVVLWTDPQ